MVSPTTSHSTTSVAPDSQNHAAPIQPAGLTIASGANQSIDERSDLLARIISRQFPIDENVRHAFCNPISIALPEDSFEGIVPLLADIINPSFLDQITGANKRYELHAKFLRGLAFCLYHIQTQIEKSRPSSLESLLLSSLMPIYLASSRDRIVPAVESTLGKLRHTFCTVGWLQVMESDVGYQWLEEQTKRGECLESIIEHGLRISIARISSRYWSTAAGSHCITDADKGMWDITCQLIRGNSQIHIPKSISLGVVSWEKILQHWNSLKQALITSVRSNRLHDFSITGPVEGTCLDQKISDSLTSLSIQVASATDGSSSESKSVSSSTPSTSAHVSNDRRLVEIRSSSDPQLKKVLEQLLQRSREEQSMLTIAVVSQLMPNQENRCNWFSPMIEQIIEESEAEDLKGFVTDAGELALMFYDVERSDVAYWLRESFSKLRTGNSNSMHSESSEQLIAGVAMVNSPTRAFQLDQLIDAAWRCRDGAAIQGSNAVKTIEVY